MLQASGLTLHYGQSQILHGIDLTARTVQITAVMGTNGVGKTTLLKAIAGRHPFSGGTLSVVLMRLRSTAEQPACAAAYRSQQRSLACTNH